MLGFQGWPIPLCYLLFLPEALWMNLRHSNLKVLIDIPLSYSLQKRQQSPFTIVLPNHKAQMSFENVALRRFL